MIDDVSIRGAEKLAILSRALKDVGDKELRRELYAGLNRSVRPLREDVRASAPFFLPARYALELRHDLKVTTRRRTGGRNPAIFLLGRAKQRDVRSLNRGRLRHPLYGNRKYWYTTRIRPGFWTVPLARGAPQVRRELERTLNEVAEKVVRRIR
jgi:hypothetical protein